MVVEAVTLLEGAPRRRDLAVGHAGGYLGSYCRAATHHLPTLVPPVTISLSTLLGSGRSAPTGLQAFTCRNGWGPFVFASLPACGVLQGSQDSVVFALDVSLLSDVPFTKSQAI